MFRVSCASKDSGRDLGHEVRDTYPRKVDARLPGKGIPHSHGARPVHLIIIMIKWIRTSRLSIKKSLSETHSLSGAPRVFSVSAFRFGVAGVVLKISGMTPQPRNTA